MMYSVTQNTKLPCYLLGPGVRVSSELERQREVLTSETTMTVLELWTRRRVLHEQTEFTQSSTTSAGQF